MDASTDASITSLTTVTGRRWPRRHTRSAACASAAAFHHGLARMTRLAAPSETPTPPTFKEASSSWQPGTSRRRCSAAARAGRDTDPSNRTYRTPRRELAAARVRSSRRRKEVNWEKVKRTVFSSGGGGEHGQDGRGLGARVGGRRCVGVDAGSCAVTVATAAVTAAVAVALALRRRPRLFRIAATDSLLLRRPPLAQRSCPGDVTFRPRNSPRHKGHTPTPRPSQESVARHASQKMWRQRVRMRALSSVTAFMHTAQSRRSASATALATRASTPARAAATPDLRFLRASSRLPPAASSPASGDHSAARVLWLAMMTSFSASAANHHPQYARGDQLGQLCLPRREHKQWGEDEGGARGCIAGVTIAGR